MSFHRKVFSQSFSLYSGRTYFHNNRRYGYYQPNGYGQTYPGQNQPEQYPGNTGLGDDKFKYDPVSNSFDVIDIC